MIIDLSKSREEYFADPKTIDILRRLTGRQATVSLENICQLNQTGKVVAGNQAGTLDSLLDLDFTVDSLALVRKIQDLEPDQLLVLPQKYRINAGQSRTALVYALDNLVNLETMGVKRALLLGSVPKGRLSAKRRREEKWDPEKVISTAFNQLHQEKHKLAEKVLVAYSWFGKDKHRRVVSLYRAIQGAELRAFQDYAAFKLLIPVMRKELQLAKSAKSKYQQNLTGEQMVRRRAKVRRYGRYLKQRAKEGDPIGSYIRRMDVEFSDLIEPISRSFAHRSGRIVRVPSASRSDINYMVKLTGLPLVKPDDNRAYSVVWDLRGTCGCEDKLYRGDRRRSAIDIGHDEVFFTFHEIAAAHTVRKIQENDPDKQIPFLPFVIPTQEMMDYVDKLRHQTVIFTYNAQSGVFKRRALNHTEIENLLWKKVMADGYQDCFTTNIDTFKRKKYDPHLDLIKFRG